LSPATKALRAEEHSAQDQSDRLGAGGRIDLGYRPDLTLALRVRGLRTAELGQGLVDLVLGSLVARLRSANTDQ